MRASHALTDSRGQEKENPRFLRRSDKALKRLGRCVSRKVKGSKNRAKARVRLARKHLQVQRQRRDFAAKTARALVMSNDVIAYEDLRVANMVKNQHLSKSISDAGWRAFRTWLEYLATVYSTVVVAVPPEYTTQECSRCGTLVTKTLSERTHVCPKCGLVLGRDHNTAVAILSRGLALLAQTTVGHDGKSRLGRAEPGRTAAWAVRPSACSRGSSSSSAGTTAWSSTPLLPTRGPSRHTPRSASTGGHHAPVRARS
jgi:putative transposase